MSYEKIIRLSGLAALVGGGAALFFNLIVPLQLFPASLEPPRQLITQTLIIFAFMGIYAAQSRKAGVLGLIGFVITQISLILNVCMRYLYTFVAPVLLSQYPEAITAVGQTGAWNSIVMATLWLFVLGYVLFGAATIRARVLPKAAAWMLIVGAVLSYLLMMLPINIGGILANAALVWIGWTLWTTRSRAASQAHAAATF